MLLLFITSFPSRRGFRGRPVFGIVDGLDAAAAAVFEDVWIVGTELVLQGLDVVHAGVNDLQLKTKKRKL